MKLPDGRVFSAVDCLAEAIHFDPTYTYKGSFRSNQPYQADLAWLLLSMEASASSAAAKAPLTKTARRRCGTTTASAAARKIVSRAGRKRKTVTLSDGRVVGTRELFVDAIKLQPRCPSHYEGLARCLAPRKAAKLDDGRVMGAAALGREAASLRRAHTPHCG